MPPLESGIYVIINARFKNTVVLPDDNDRSDIVGETNAEDDNLAKVWRTSSALYNP